MNCRHCGSRLEHTFLDLGYAPPSNAYLSKADLNKTEKCFPLKIMVCTNCWLVQTEDYAQAGDLFSAEYAYFSSTSSSWLAHAKAYTEAMTDRLGLDDNSLVIEVASNDGYLLRNFIENGIPCLGIEPTDSTADAAEALGIPVLREFFGESLGRQLASDDKQADLIAGNNVYAHVPDINDFTQGTKSSAETDWNDYARIPAFDAPDRTSLSLILPIMSTFLICRCTQSNEYSSKRIYEYLTSKNYPRMAEVFGFSDVI